MPKDRTSDRRHTVGAILIRAGILLAILSVVLLLPVIPYWGAFFFLVSLLASLCGVYLKRKYCPRCREGFCGLDNSEAGNIDVRWAPRVRVRLQLSHDVPFRTLRYALGIAMLALLVPAGPVALRMESEISRAPATFSSSPVHF